MENELSNNNQAIFEQIKRIDLEGNEYWGARELSKVLDYRAFRNFQPVIVKAKDACLNSNQSIENHFVDFHEMVTIGSGTMPEDLPTENSIKNIERLEQKKLNQDKNKR